MILAKNCPKTVKLTVTLCPLIKVYSEFEGNPKVELCSMLVSFDHEALYNDKFFEAVNNSKD